MLCARSRDVPTERDVLERLVARSASRKACHSLTDLTQRMSNVLSSALSASHAARIQ